MKLEAKLDCWQQLADGLEVWGKTVPLSDRIQHRVRLVAEEWFLNIVHHGLDTSVVAAPSLLLVGVQASVVEIERDIWKTIELVFTDNGEPFDPLLHPMPNLQPNVEQINYGGLGIYLIRQLCSYCHYERTERCNRLSMQIRNDCI